MNGAWQKQGGGGGALPVRYPCRDRRRRNINATQGFAPHRCDPINTDRMDEETSQLEQAIIDEIGTSVHHLYINHHCPGRLGKTDYAFFPVRPFRPLFVILFFCRLTFLIEGFLSSFFGTLYIRVTRSYTPLFCYTTNTTVTMQIKSLLFGLVAAEAAMASLPLRVVTWNIRYAASSLEQGEKPWFDIFCWATKSRCRQYKFYDKLNQIVSSTPNGAPMVIGMQEVLDNQLNDIQNSLGDGWAHIGVGRDDGKKAGEYSPIFYQTSQLRVLASETKWLSPTPDSVSFGWGAGSRRIVTTAVFEHIATGEKFIHANTHLDNVSAQARSEGIKVVLTRIQAARVAFGPLPVSLTGDFNSAPYADAFKTLADTGFMKGELYDLATPAQHAGPYTTTYTTFREGAGESRIDFIWLGAAQNYPYSVVKYEIWDHTVDGMRVSDHRPVVGDVILR